MVIVRRVAERQVIVACSAEAKQGGIRVGMTLTQARALCADLAHAEHEPQRDRRALEALGRWLTRFTPFVAIESVDDADGLYLDITGCERLFGGFEPLLQQVASALARLHISARCAIAPTPGAAWALASASREPAIVSPSQLRSSLLPLPALALRLSQPLVAALHHLGLETIEQVIDLPRGVLPARFGEELLRRIDQAMGHLPEPLVPLSCLPSIAASMEFDGVVSAPEAIWAVFQHLSGQILPQLERRGCGVRKLQVQLRPPYSAAIVHELSLARPSRDPKKLLELFRWRLEDATVPSREPQKRFRRSHPAGSISTPKVHDDGYISMSLRVLLMEPMVDEQIALTDQEQFLNRVELDRLLERLRLRLGEEAVVQVTLVESHNPEGKWEGKGGRKKARGGEARRHEGTEARRVGEARRGEVTEAQSRGRRDASPFVPSCLRAFVPSASAPFVPSSLRPFVPSPANPFIPSPLHLPLRAFVPSCVRASSLPGSPHPLIHVMVSPSDDAEGRPILFRHENRVHQVRHAIGPHRIEGRWWEGRDKTRDYFDIEDTAGRRFWVFRVRQTNRWFLHGSFE